MKVAKWGNSLAVRLPAAVVDALGLQEGDEVQIKAADGQLTLQRTPGTEELWARLHALREKLPADFRFDREDANGRDRDGATAR
ncbi:AbrB/MazE/SpoVT family DNA-binding domain-containing protein [Roseateles sp. DC23W]|uniref:AbrB/MazE/SpoVT family DNA-binding domain-containing protein n=1 Tax=Pelomonas dachongensis TaxID=3299029 RepID=A0ABW7EKQ1_9BURK